jgi:hypothetical protein
MSPPQGVAFDARRRTQLMVELGSSHFMYKVHFVVQ